jgi:hypothetical protein
MKLISTHTGHIFRTNEKNSYKIWEDDKGKYIEMFSKHGSFYFDYDDFDYVTSLNDKKITWCLEKEIRLKYRDSYYVRGGINGKKVYIHQYIMNFYGQGSKGLTIDHIDRNPLNNRRYNLRLATKSEQSSNISKRERGCHASSLPDGIKSSDLPKYVSYTQYKRNTKLGYYDMFIIQCHPFQKPEYGEKSKWATQMSMKISIHDKLKQAIEKLDEFNNKLKIKRHIQIAGNS